MRITSNTIFYFSGTGNSLQVALDLKDKLQEGYQVQPISETFKSSEVVIDSQSIGIVFPVYMLGIPLLVADFIKKMHFTSNPYIFAVATCGGNVGRSFIQLNDLFDLHQRPLNAEFTVKMPANNILRYDAKPIDVQTLLFEGEKESISKIAHSITVRHKVRSTNANPLVNIIAPLLYKKLERQYGSVPAFSTTQACNGCGLCQKICCVDNISLNDKKPLWSNHCQQCMACIQHCPKEAIQHGPKTVDRTRYKNPNVSIISQNHKKINNPL